MRKRSGVAAAAIEASPVPREGTAGEQTPGPTSVAKLRSEPCEHCGEVLEIEAVNDAQATCSCKALHLFCFNGEKAECFLPLLQPKERSE